MNLLWPVRVQWRSKHVHLGFPCDQKRIARRTGWFRRSGHVHRFGHVNPIELKQGDESIESSDQFAARFQVKEVAAAIDSV